MLKLALRNFRSFSENNPVNIDLNEKFVSISGPNNSGKSSVLRSFFELRPLYSYLSYVSNLKAPEINQFRVAIAAPNQLDVFPRQNQRDMRVEVDFIGESEDIRISAYVTVSRSLESSIAFICSDARNAVDQMPESRLQVIAETFSQLASSIYAGPFRNALSVTPTQRYYDLDIGAAFIQAFDNWRSGPDSFRRYEVRKLITAVAKIFGFDSLEVTTSLDNQTLTVDLPDGSYTLPELGAGISQFLILVLHAATFKPKFLLLDEPELNLHPRLQIELLQLLGSYCDTVIFSTHNLGLARTLANTRYLSERKGNGAAVFRTQDKYPRLPELLGEMNYSGQHELLDGVAATLFVEGPSDVPVFRHFLSLLHRVDRVLVLSLNGASSIKSASVPELHELKRVSRNVYVIIDSEKAAESSPISAERQRFVDSCRAANIAVHVLERRAIENYFPKRAIFEAFDTTYGSLGRHQLLKEAVKPWRKSDNASIARKMSIDELKLADFYNFLLLIDIAKDSEDGLDIEPSP